MTFPHEGIFSEDSRHEAQSQVHPYGSLKVPGVLKKPHLAFLPSVLSPVHQIDRAILAYVP